MRPKVFANSFLAAVSVITAVIAIPSAEALTDSAVTVNLPCDLIEDECVSTQQRLNAGSITLEYTGSLSYVLQAIYDYGWCGLSHFVGTVPSGESVVVYVGDQYVMDNVANDSRFFEAGVEVHEYSTPSQCNGTLVYKGSDFATWTSPIAARHQQAWGDDGARCTGTQGDPSSFHLPDVTLTRPTGTGTQQRCYSVKLWARYCLSAGVSCSAWASDFSTVAIDWL